MGGLPLEADPSCCCGGYDAQVLTLETKSCYLQVHVHCVGLLECTNARVLLFTER